MEQGDYVVKPQSTSHAWDGSCYDGSKKARSNPGQHGTTKVTMFISQ